jgi:hypothetical protein
MGTKDELIIVRIDSATKQRFIDAAQSRGQSLTTFLLSAAEEAVRKEKKMPVIQKPRGKGPCPTWFLATCHEAGRGGANTYAWAGHKLLGSIASEMSYEYDDEEWNAKLDELEALLDANDDHGVLAWFDRELPRCMKLVPRRRRQQFLKGLNERFKEEGINR